MADTVTPELRGLGCPFACCAPAEGHDEPTEGAVIRSTSPETRTTAWLVLIYDKYQYQGRAGVRGVYATEEAATKAAAVIEAEIDDDNEVVYVQDYEVES